jgi:predicted RNA-binding Zn ribbon-like protein
MSMKFIAGSLCLDFVNTVGGRASRRPYTVLRDKLGTYEDLLMWSRLAGLVSPAGVRSLERRAAGKPKEAFVVLKRAAALREALYRVFRSVVDGRRPIRNDIEILERELSIARDHERLSPAAGAFVWTWDNRDALDQVLWAVSRSAAELLTSKELARLRQCGGDECGWMFLDTSRNRSRQWCDMRDCGNRAKVRKFREKRKTTGIFASRPG